MQGCCGAQLVADLGIDTDDDEEPTPKKAPSAFALRAEDLLVPPPKAPAIVLKIPPVASGSKRPASEQAIPAVEDRPAKRPRVSPEGVWERFARLEETMIAWRSQVEREVHDLNQKMLDLAKKSSDGNAAMERARADLAKAIREMECQEEGEESS